MDEGVLCWEIAEHLSRERTRTFSAAIGMGFWMRTGPTASRLWTHHQTQALVQPRMALSGWLSRATLHTSTLARDSGNKFEGAATAGASEGARGWKRLSAGVKPRPYRTVAPAAERLVVIGDVHGDLDAFRSCLRMANLVDRNDKWAGGDTVLVQLGDIFDRGNDDLIVEEWVYRLAQEASQADGAVYSLLGNHEMMNAMGDHSMATRRAFRPFEDLRAELDDSVGGDWSSLEGFPKWARCRVLAMRPGEAVARLLAAHAVCMKVGDNLFVHGGLLPSHLRAAKSSVESAKGNVITAAEDEMEEMNAAACAWLLGEKPIPEVLWGIDSPLWTRLYSDPESREIEDEARSQLEEVLRTTGTKRMLVGHTPQRMGINSAADGQIWRVDTGMTSMMGGRPEVLEIRGEDMTILSEYRSIPASKRVARPRKTTTDA